MHAHTTFSILARSLVCSGLLLMAGSADAQLADTVWPTFQHDAQHTGRADVNGPQGPDIQIEWSYKGRSKWRSSIRWRNQRKSNSGRPQAAVHAAT